MASAPAYAASPVALPEAPLTLLADMKVYMRKVVDAAGLGDANLAFAGAKVQAVISKLATTDPFDLTLDDYLVFSTFITKAAAFADRIIANAPMKDLQGRANVKPNATDCLIPDTAPLFLRTRVQWARGSSKGWPLTAADSQALDALLASGPVDLLKMARAESKAAKEAAKELSRAMERQVILDLLREKFPDCDDPEAFLAASIAAKKAQTAAAEAKGSADEDSPKSALHEDSEDEDISSDSDHDTPILKKPAASKPLGKPPLAPTKATPVKPAAKAAAGAVKRTLDMAAAVHTPLKRTRNTVA